MANPLPSVMVINLYLCTRSMMKLYSPSKLHLDIKARTTATTTRGIRIVNNLEL